MPKKSVLFDFDGVIVDSFRVVHEVARMECPHTTEEDYRERFEGNIYDQKESDEIHTTQCRKDIDFYAEYAPRLQTEVSLFAGMPEVLARLARDYDLIIVSSTTTRPIEEFLRMHDLASHFSLVMGADVHTSKTTKIRMVLERDGTDPKRDMVFITDTLGDMREATAASVNSIGVTWGFHRVERLLRGDPFQLVETPDELYDAILKFFTI